MDDRQSDMASAFTRSLRFWLACVTIVASGLLVPARCSSAPPYSIKQTPELSYVARPTWFESMVASRRALQADEAEGRRPVPRVAFHSDMVRGRQPARPISVSVDGVDEIYLYVTGAPDVEYGAADWIAPRVTDADGKETLLCSNKFIDLQDGFHTVDCSLRSRVDPPLMVADKQYPHGINIQAPGKIRIRLPVRAVRFQSMIGIDDWVNPESYRLPQPFYYQPHHFSEAALRSGAVANEQSPANGAVRFHVVDEAGAARLDLWKRLAVEFSDAAARKQMTWEREDRLLEQDWSPGDWKTLALRYAAACDRVRGARTEAMQLAGSVADFESLQRVRGIYHRSREVHAAFERATRLPFDNVRAAIQDLVSDHGNTYPNGNAWLKQLRQLESEVTDAVATYQSRREPRAVDRGLHDRLLKLVRAFDALRSDALLSNPLLDWQRLLLVRRTPHGDPRRAMGRGYGVSEYIGYPRQSSKCNPGIEQPFSWENDICVLSPVAPDGQVSTLYQPEGRRLLKDLDLNWDASSILFSMPGSHDRWQVFEVRSDGTGLRQLTPTDQPDVHFYDPCWLPNGQIAMVSTAPLQGVPCNTGVIVGMMFKMNRDGTGIRQLAFEQDHTYNPTVMPDGRILYLRWDYTDTPHVWNRVMFTMNPDGSGQSEFYGSNSYWPNALFHARPVPGHPTKFVGIVTGHHVGRAGEMILFDRSQGRFETDGVVQRIGDREAVVQPLIEDKLTAHSWPKFLNPFPLSDKYFLVSCKPTPDSLWGIYLVDVFDNLVLVKEEEGRALLEPIPLRPTVRPPVISPRTVPDDSEGMVYIADIYSGPGLRGIPRGSVKSLRVFTYHFAYQKQAGIQHRVGADGPWEVKRVLGTVPVEPDGSVFFRVPSKTPISLQPLDGEGKAVQLMRSWMTVMPGETQSCLGCHEDNRGLPSVPPRRTLASLKAPVSLTPWYGPPRGFSFAREVQPVLDKFCVSCHGGHPENKDHAAPNLTAQQGVLWAYEHGQPRLIRFENTSVDELMKKYSGIFPPSYVELRRQVRVGGLESDLHLLPPTEFHADTSRLVQMLRKGHHGVRLNQEAWDRLITWIDLNAPCYGTWSEFTSIRGNQDQRRCELRAMYGGRQENGETIIQGDPPFAGDLTPVIPATRQSVSGLSPRGETPDALLPAGDAGPTSGNAYPVSVPSSRQNEYLELDLGSGTTMRLVKIPAGVDSGSTRVDRPFWMSCCEVTNRQYAQIHPEHDSRFEHRGSWIFSEEYLGWPLNTPDQPVVRVSWNEAEAWCRQLSARTGRTIRLPSEEEWEYACRGGSSSDFWFGDRDADYSEFANLADASLSRLADDSWNPKPPDLVARDQRYDDRHLVTAKVGSFVPNPFGLHDMHGNVAEWTSGWYGPAGGRRPVRGGSWRDLPAEATAAERYGYRAYQKAVHVGFRVVCEVDAEP